VSDTGLDNVMFLFRANRERGDDRPRERPQRIFVDPSGRLRVGDSVPATEGPGLSEVPRKTFA
jgi:hypothetical protein